MVKPLRPQKRADQDDQLIVQPLKGDWLKLLSQNDPNKLDDYKSDGKQGQGITIYILDKGFKINPSVRGLISP